MDRQRHEKYCRAHYPEGARCRGFALGGFPRNYSGCAHGDLGRRSEKHSDDCPICLGTGINQSAQAIWDDEQKHRKDG